MLSSTLRKGEKRLQEESALINSIRLSHSFSANARVLPAALDRGDGQFHVHQGGGGQALRVQRPVQQAGEEERLQQDALGVSSSAIINIITLQDARAKLTIKCFCSMPKTLALTA